MWILKVNSMFVLIGIDLKFVGNYNTSVAGTELVTFNRSLYGAQLDYRSRLSTSLGDERKHIVKSLCL